MGIRPVATLKVAMSIASALSGHCQSDARPPGGSCHDAALGRGPRFAPEYRPCGRHGATIATRRSTTLAMPFVSSSGCWVFVVARALGRALTCRVPHGFERLSRLHRAPGSKKERQGRLGLCIGEGLQPGSTSCQNTDANSAALHPWRWCIFAHAYSSPLVSLTAPLRIRVSVFGLLRNVRNSRKRFDPRFIPLGENCPALARTSA